MDEGSVVASAFVFSLRLLWVVHHPLPPLHISTLNLIKEEMSMPSTMTSIYLSGLPIPDFSSTPPSAAQEREWNKRHSATQCEIQ